MFCLYRLCLLFTIVKLGQGSGVWSESQPVQNFEVVRDDYLSREKSLWQLIRSKGDKKEYNAEKICDTHKQFMGINFGEIGLLRSVLDDDQLSRANRSVIDSILNINRTFDTGYELLYNGMYDRLPAYTDDVLHRFTSYCNEAKKTIVNHEFWNSVKNSSQHCRKHTAYILAENQVLYEIYKELSITFLKSYMVTQFAYMISTAKGVENYHQFAFELRNTFLKDINLIKETATELENAPNVGREMWACDVKDFTKEDSFVEVTRFYQGFIANEINLNSRGDCDLSCSDYSFTWQFNCKDETLCSKHDIPRRHSTCRGTVQNCISIESDMEICPAPATSTRRYNFIKYKNGRLLGVGGYCQKRVSVHSWWNWFYKCDNCFCYCDDPGTANQPSDSDRYFSLRAAVSDITENKVVTGVAITKINRIIQLKIAQRKLLPRGSVNMTDDPIYPEIQWKTAQLFNLDDENVQDGKDYFTLTWVNRSIALTSAIIDDGERVMTGVRFRQYHNHIRLEVRATRFDYERGELKDLTRNDWVGYSSNLRELKMYRPDVPTKSKQKSRPVSEDNHFIQFAPSDLDKDGAQTTVPYLDATKIEANVPLLGTGLYYKTTYGYGGFIAPKLIVFNSAKYISAPSFT